MADNEMIITSSPPRRSKKEALVRVPRYLLLDRQVAKARKFDYGAEAAVTKLQIVFNVTGDFVNISYDYLK